MYRALNLNTGQMVAVKRIGLEGLKEDEILQLMREVDLVKRLSHPSSVKYEGMGRDENTLNIVLEFAPFICSCVRACFCYAFLSSWHLAYTDAPTCRYAENGSLGQTLKAFGKLNEKLVASYVCQ